MIKKVDLFLSPYSAFSPSVDMINWCITVGTKPPNSNSVMRMPFMCTSEGVSFSHSCF